MSVPVAYRTRIATFCAVVAAAAVAVSPARASEAAPQISAPPAPAATAAPAQSLEQRLSAVGYRLAVGSAGLCARPQMMTGLMLHDIAGYALADRAAALAAHRLGQGFGVLSVVPGSAADRAGLRRGDEIVAIGDVDLEQFETGLIGPRPTYDRVEAMIARMDDVLRAGPARIAVRRAGAREELTLAGEPGCGGGEFVLESSRMLNAWSDGRNVAVTTRMMDFAASEDELAFVVSHEMAHNILGHGLPAGTTSNLLPAAGAGRARPSSRQREFDADHLAVTIMAGGRYQLAAATAFLARSGGSSLLNLSLSHPSNGRRITMVNEAIAALPAPVRSDVQVAEAAPAVTLPALAPTLAVEWTGAVRAPVLGEGFVLRLDVAPLPVRALPAPGLPAPGLPALGGAIAAIDLPMVRSR